MWKRMICVYLLLLVFSYNVFGQQMLTKTGFIGFYSKTPFEDIKAENNQAYAVLDAASHHIAFAVLLKGFIFPKELMQEHFNENYMESDKYPKATFTGTCSGDMELRREGTYQVVIKGDLNLHGITRPVETTAELDVKKDRIIGIAVFKLKPEDFQISIPGIVREKIAREIEVKVHTDWMRTN
jgi:polyisoprenoid-binding protein YceI